MRNKSIAYVEPLVLFHNLCTAPKYPVEGRGRAGFKLDKQALRVAARTNFD